jgi:hypothetical protein
MSNFFNMSLWAGYFLCLYYGGFFLHGLSVLLFTFPTLPAFCPPGWDGKGK